MPKTDYRNIECVEGICGGEPVVAGTRISVRVLIGYHKLGYTVEEILDGFPQLRPGDVYDAFAYYYDHLTEIDDLIQANREALLMQQFPPGKAAPP